MVGERTYYLDHAAATPCDERVLAAMLPYMSTVFYNPSSPYSGGREARHALNQARQDIAVLLGAKAHDVIFTAGATESINLAIQGILSAGGHAVISGIEHPAVRSVADHYPHTIVNPNKQALITPEDVRNAINDDTTLVSIVMADSEFGAVQPLADIARTIEGVRVERANRGNKTPLYFHTDASQAALSLELKVARLGVDMMTLNAGKCYGPKQVGLLWIASHVHLQPLVYGGGQERSLRSGTENVAGAVGFARALQLAQGGRHTEAQRLKAMRAEMIKQLKAAVPGIVFDGSTHKYLPGHIHIHIDGLDAERVVFHLDTEGIFVATGAACAANKATRSPSLEAIGLSPSEADGSLRITLGHLNNIQDVPFVVERIANAIAVERQL